MPRVLFWTETFWPYVGGPDVAGPRLALALRKIGHELLVVTSHGSLDLPNEDNYQGLPIRRFPFYAALANRDLKQLATIHRELFALRREFRPDLVHINFLGPSAVLQVQTARAHPAPLLVTLRGMLPDNLLQPNAGFQPVLSEATWVTANSSAALEQCRRHLPELTARSSVLYDGINLSWPGPGAPPGPPRLLCLGRLSPEKGFDLALRAFSAIAEQFPTVQLVVAGDGPERAALERLAVELGLSDRVELTGWVSPERIAALLESVSLLIVPSRTESLPFVAIEAGAAARPVIATRVGGVAEIVQHDRTGLLVDDGDVDGIALAIASLLRRPDRARTLGSAARRWVEQRFSQDASVSEYHALYVRLTGEVHAC